MIHTMKTIKLYFLLLSFAAGLASLTSCNDEPMPVAKAPVFAMNESFTITATCPNSYKAFINGEEITLPYTVTQTYKQQTIVVSGYGYGEGMQNSEAVEQSFEVPANLDGYVDLGLPSGTLWATCNVGASAPEEFGDYFAWGETEPKDYYDWSTYKWCNGNEETLTKYCEESSLGYNGFVDNKTELDPEDDAACAHYPGGRMPSWEQIQELCDSCTWKWTQLNGVNGMLVTGPNGNTMFLPSADSKYDSPNSYFGPGGNYWSRTLDYDSTCSIGLGFFSGYIGIWGDHWHLQSCFRYAGFTVRAVLDSQN